MRCAFRVSVVLFMLACCGLARAQNGFAAIDQLVNHAIDEHLLPGAVVVVGHDGRVVFRKAYGMRSLEPTREATSLDTIFDMASLTKCLATTTAVMQLFQRGDFRFDDA